MTLDSAGLTARSSVPVEPLLRPPLIEVVANYGTLGSIATFVLAVLAQWIAITIKARNNRARESQPRVEQRSSDRTATFNVGAPSSGWESETRIVEARAAASSYQQVARWNRLTTNLLTFGQYVIGGVLATSFAQSALPTTLVGLLGVLVLLSSLIHQRYRPDLRARNGQARAVSLRQTVRTAEDLLYELRQAKRDGGVASATVPEVRALVSAALHAADLSELYEHDAANASDSAAPAGRSNQTPSGPYLPSPPPSPLPAAERAMMQDQAPPR